MKENNLFFSLNVVDKKLLFEIISIFKNLSSENILIEFDLKNKIFVIKYLNDSKTFLKILREPLENLFEINDEFLKNYKNIKIQWGLFYLSKFLKILKMLKEKNLKIKFKIKNTSDAEIYEVESLIIYDDNIKFELPAAMISLFIQISDETENSIFDLDNYLIKINLTAELLEKLNNLISLDLDDYLIFELKNNEFFIKNKVFNLKYDDEIDIKVKKDFKKVLAKDKFIINKMTNYDVYFLNKCVAFLNNNLKICSAYAAIDDEI